MRTLRCIVLQNFGYVNQVTNMVRGFDDHLNRELEVCARDAGEDVEEFVARAVASRMVAERRKADNADVDDLVTRLTNAGLYTNGAMPNVSEVINDPDRLRALHDTGLLDSPPEAVYDRITRAAADALDAPFSAVSLIDVDRQYFLSDVGIGGTRPEERQTPLDRSVCQYAVANGTPLVLEDARIDPLFKNHPAVLDGTVRSYLGIPLSDHDGNAIGTLCVFDVKPRLWGSGHIQVLTDLASLAAERIFASRAQTSR